MITCGLSIEEEPDTINLRPINSKDSLGNCIIGIPKDKWIGTALDAILAQKHLRPMLLGLHPLLDEMLEPLMKGEH